MQFNHKSASVWGKGCSVWSGILRAFNINLKLYIGSLFSNFSDESRKSVSGKIGKIEEIEINYSIPRWWEDGTECREGGLNAEVFVLGSDESYEGGE